MLGTKFVVNLSGGDFHLWNTFQTDDEERVRRFWLQRTGLSCIEQISEAEYWDLADLCHKRNVVFMGYVK